MQISLCIDAIFCELFKQYFLFMDIYIYSLIERCKSLCISEFEIISSPPDRWPANKVPFEACPNLWLGQKKYFRKKNISYMKGLQATKIIKGIQCAKKKSVIKKNYHNILSLLDLKPLLMHCIVFTSHSEARIVLYLFLCLAFLSEILSKTLLAIAWLKIKWLFVSIWY